MVLGVVLRDVDIEHSHAPNSAEIEARKIVNKLKKKAKQSNDVTGNIIAMATRGISDAAAVKLCTNRGLARRVQRVRNANNPQLPTPNTREQLELPDWCRITIRNQPFFLGDSEDGKNRYLIFSTARNLEILSDCRRWFTDGTFSSVPIIFTQLYTIHGLYKDVVLPFVYILVSGKSIRIYTAVLNPLKTLEPRLEPRSVMMDFESAFVNGLNEVFPETQIHGCHFHFAQAVWRHIQKTNLQPKYGQDCESATNIKMLVASAFVPVGDVVIAYEQLIKCAYYVEHEVEFEHLIGYFEITWIGELKRNRRA